DVVDMTLNPATNMLDMLTVPADIPDRVAREAEELARRTIEALDDVGVFAIELFMTADGTLYVNEVSPRTHNSGHYTIDACETSQLEARFPAVTGMPRGDPALHRPAAMINLVGGAGVSGPTVVEGEEEVLGIDGVHLHPYGKREGRPGRKMGHVTVVADRITDAVARANRVGQRLVIRGRDPLPAVVAGSS